jgi:hypothetical protein
VRYLHYEADHICNYVRSRHLAITKCDFQKKLPPGEVSVAAIEEMVGRSETLWGSALPYYLYVSSSFEREAPSLDEAVSQMEGSSADPVNFLVVAYQDGGVITVSRSKLPFQTSAREAEWWRPYKSASRSAS